jgi:DNA-binding CsgD family transcriptional regulator
MGVRNSVFIPWRNDAALALRALGDVDSARSLANEDLEAARSWGTAGALGSAYRLLASLSTRDDATDLYRESVRQLERSPARLEHARAAVEFGAQLRRSNHRVAAGEPLRIGLELADQCGATVLVRRAREELAAIGVKPRRTRLSGIDALTPSERRVAQLATNGLNNIEIAQTLFVTKKTVEKHLGNAYLKLGINARSRLPAFFPNVSPAHHAKGDVRPEQDF